MNKKYGFFTQNIFKKVLFVLMGTIFATEFAQCAIRTAEAEEEIGSHTRGNITELDTPVSSRYEHLDWWLSVLPVIKTKAGIEEFDTYEKIVRDSLNHIGLVYKRTEDEYIGQMFADGFGLGIISDDFEAAFNKKLEEFKNFSTNYLKSKAIPQQEAYVTFYNSNEGIFKGILQKKELLKIERYQVIHIGDLHGDLISILTILKNHENLFNTDFSIKNKDLFFVFTGDYIDRGQFGLEILFILMSLKIKNPDNVFLMLGNHEAGHLFLSDYNQGFAREVAQKFNFGTIEFADNHILGTGVPQFTEFMQKIQSKLFRYLPTALFMKTEFGNILFCHGLPDPTIERVRYFLEAPAEIQIDFINIHPQLMRFTDSDLEIKIVDPGDTNAEARRTSAQPLEVIGDYMNKTGIFLCMRGHQHNSTIGANFDVYSGGVILNQVYTSSVVVTTLSLDFACYMPSLQKIGKIGNYAYCCVLEKEGASLKIKGISIDRYTAERVTQTDRTNPECEIHSIDRSEGTREKITPTESPEHRKISQLCMEIQKLSASGPQLFSCPNITTLQTKPLWIVENFHYFFSQIQNMHKIDINMIYELFFLLNIMSKDGSLSVSKSTTLSPENKLALIQIMRDEAQGPFQLISNIKDLRKELASYVFKINDPRKFKSQIRDCLYRINQNRFLLGQKLCDIIRMFESIQAYLNQPDEPKKSIAKKLKDLVPNPEILTFEHILLAILGKPEQDAV